MINSMRTEEILKLLAKFYPVYQILWDGPTKLTDIKQQLMDYFDMAESTARSYINAIVAYEAGPLDVDEDELVSVNQNEVIEIEERLENIFDWQEFDPRHDAYAECNKKRIEMDLKNQDLHHMLKQSYADRDKYEKQTKKKVEELEATLQEKELELRENKKRLGETLRFSAWKFLGYRIFYKLFDGESRLQKEGL